MVPSRPYIASLCSSHFSLWLVFLIHIGEERTFSLIYLLSGDAQRVNELMFIKCSASQREAMDRTQGVAVAHSGPPPRSA